MCVCVVGGVNISTTIILLLLLLNRVSTYAPLHVGIISQSVCSEIVPFVCKFGHPAAPIRQLPIRVFFLFNRFPPLSFSPSLFLSLSLSVHVRLSKLCCHTSGALGIVGFFLSHRAHPPPFSTSPTSPHDFHRPLFFFSCLSLAALVSSSSPLRLLLFSWMRERARARQF